MYLLILSLHDALPLCLPYFVSLCRLARQAFTTWRSILTNMARILQLTSRQAQRELMLRQAIKFAGWIHRRSLGSWSKSCQLTRFLTAFLRRSGRLRKTGTGGIPFVNWSDLSHRAIARCR